MHEPIAVDLRNNAFAIVGVADGALIGDGLNHPEYENWRA